MAKPKAGRASKFTPQAIQKIKEMVAQGLSREEIAQRLDVTMGSLQVTCSRLGVSLRRPRMRFPSYELLKPELKRSRAGLEVEIVITIQHGDLLRTLDVPLSNKAIGELALLASLRKVGLVELIAQILSGAVDKGLVEKILSGNNMPPKA